jgi:hypothetical protein
MIGRVSLDEGSWWKEPSPATVKAMKKVVDVLNTDAAVKKRQAYATLETAKSARTLAFAVASLFSNLASEV